MTPSWPDLIRAFGRIGLMSFGGPAGQIAVMHSELVEDRDWLTEDQFLAALSFCMLLPGPEAMQLATYAGWKLRGIAGGLLAGLLFVLPGAAVMLALVWAYAVWGHLPLLGAVFLGIKAAVVIVVVQALLRLAGKALKSRDRRVLALLAFAAIYVFSVPFPAIVIAAAIYGFATSTSPTPETLPPATKSHPLATLIIWGALWWAPVALAWATGAERLTQIGLYFSKLAVVTFGGAYAVLAYMAQTVVSDYGWLTPGQMMDGLGLAETTPGPLILVTEFVGFLAGYAQGGAGPALMAAAMTLWVTFTPCFLWIFLGAPYLERITARPRLKDALSAITSAVVGVVAFLLVWFAIHVLFNATATLSLGPIHVLVPNLAALNMRATILCVIAAYLLLRLRIGLLQVLAMMAAAGAGVELLTG